MINFSVSYIYLFILQVLFHSLCCLARSCSEMSISSMKTCPSGTQHRIFQTLSFLCSIAFWHSAYSCCLCVFSLFIGYIQSLFTLLVIFFCQNSRWVTYISLVEDVQPQTETTWSVQKHNKQPTQIVTDLCCCFRDMFNHNRNPTNFVHSFISNNNSPWIVGEMHVYWYIVSFAVSRPKGWDTALCHG